MSLLPFLLPPYVFTFRPPFLRFWYTDEDSSATFMNWVVDVSNYESPPKVFSVSYGIPEHYLTFYETFVFDTEIKKLGLQGVTIVAASGKSSMSCIASSSASCPA